MQKETFSDGTTFSHLQAMNVYMSACKKVCVCKCRNVCMNVCMYAYMNVDVYVDKQ